MPQHWYRRLEDQAVAWMMVELWRPKPGGSSPAKADLFIRTLLRLLLLSIPQFLLTIMGKNFDATAAFRIQTWMLHNNIYYFFLFRNYLCRARPLSYWITRGANVNSPNALPLLPNGFTTKSSLFLFLNYGDHSFSHYSRKGSF